MNIKTLVIVGAPPALAIMAIVFFNPTILTWPVVAGLSLVFGVTSAVATHIVDPN